MFALLEFCESQAQTAVRLTQTGKTCNGLTRYFEAWKTVKKYSPRQLALYMFTRLLGSAKEGVEPGSAKD